LIYYIKTNVKLGGKNGKANIRSQVKEKKYKRVSNNCDIS